MVNVPFALGIDGERKQEGQQQSQHKKNTKVSFHKDLLKQQKTQHFYCVSSIALF
jgi:hypothetical protein